MWRRVAGTAPAEGPGEQAVLPSRGENVVAVAVDFGDGDGLEDDLVSALLAAEEEGDRLTHEELLSLTAPPPAPQAHLNTRHSGRSASQAS